MKFLPFVIALTIFNTTLISYVQSLSGAVEETSLWYLPFHASVHLKKQFICNAAIISQSLVLSVRTCLRDDITKSSIEKLFVAVGLNSNKEKSSSTFYPVAAVYSDLYQSKDDFWRKKPRNLKFYEFVVLRVEGLFHEDDEPVRAIPFNLKHFQLDQGGYVQLSGYSLETRRICSSGLKRTLAHFLTHEACKKVHTNLLDHHVCTDYDELKLEESYEASISDLITFKNELVGIAINDGSCEQSLEPVIYANASAFYYSGGKEFINLFEAEVLKGVPYVVDSNEVARNLRITSLDSNETQIEASPTTAK